MSGNEVTFHEMVGTWLQREFEGNWKEGIAPYIGCCSLLNKNKDYYEKIVRNPDYSHNKENMLRCTILWVFRFPLLRYCCNAKWSKKSLSEDEFKELRVINANRWKDISAPDRLGKLSNVAYNVFLDRHYQWSNEINGINYEEYKKKLKKWEENIKLNDINTKLILLKSDNTPYTILEGNKSTFSLYVKTFLKKEAKYTTIQILLGYLITKCKWQW